MSIASRIFSRVWMLVLASACGFLVYINGSRIERSEYVSGLPGRAESTEAGDSSSLTGYADEQRELILAEHNNDSYQWIVQTQQMWARGEWRVRHVDYDNAPVGREVYAASPYRWWLGLVAWVDHAVSRRPIGLSVEHAALYADPVLHGVILVGTVIFVAWQFGVFPASLLAIGLVTIFPFAASFFPAAPDDHGLARAMALASVLPLLAGIRKRRGGPLSSPQTADAAARINDQSASWFFLAGVAGGVGLWISVAIQLPILAGLGLGALFAAWSARVGEPPLPSVRVGTSRWMVWGLGGAVATFTAYLIEYFPGHLGSWQLRAIHPLYALGWLGAGGALGELTEWIQHGKAAITRRGTVIFFLGLAALGAVPVVLWKTGNPGFLAVDLQSYRLTKASTDAAATHVWNWVIREGSTLRIFGAVLPTLLVLPAAWLVLRRQTTAEVRASILLALGPVALALAFAGRQISWFNSLDVVLLVLVVVTAAALVELFGSRRILWLYSGYLMLLLLPGAILLWPRAIPEKNTLSDPELKGLVERDLAHWLAKHASPGGAVVLAPPEETMSLYYYGGLRGLGTFFWENQEGVAAAVRTMSASTKEEALSLITRRGVTHIVIPSWDPYLDEYARIGAGQVEGTFISGLHQWLLPSWLRPVAYRLPIVAGFERQSVTILEVVEEQDDATALGQLAEYFVEMGQLDAAGAVGQALRRFPADLGVWVARAEVEIARGDEANLANSLKALVAAIASGGDRPLAWSRRVSLAVVLARTKNLDLAREQIRKCVAGVTASKLQSLSTGSLHGFQVLTHAFDLEIADPKLRQLMLDLLSTESKVAAKPG